MPGILGYEVHLAQYGWRQGIVYDGVITGTAGINLQTEAIKIYGLPESIQYRAHIAADGWGTWIGSGAEAGSTGRGLKLQALQFRDVGNSGVQVWGRVHIEGTGWLEPVGMGAEIGTTGQDRAIQAIQLCLVRPTQFDLVADQPPPSASAVVRGIFDSAVCLAGLGQIGIECIGTEFHNCTWLDAATAASCVMSLQDLNEMIQGQADVAPGPGPTIGPENPPPPNWIPGGYTGLYAQPGGRGGDGPRGGGGGANHEEQNPGQGGGGGGHIELLHGGGGGE